MLRKINKIEFPNETFYLLETEDGYPVEVTSTFILSDTKNLSSIKKKKWIIGVSVMSGCPIGCKFCATKNLERFRTLTSQEIVEQILFITNKYHKGWNNEESFLPQQAKEFRINYTRMGEPFLNIDAVKKVIDVVDNGLFIGVKAQHYISTIGIKNADYSWIKENMALQFSIHSFDEKYRDFLIPYEFKASLEELGKVRTKSNFKTILNLTIGRNRDFDIKKLRKWFPKEYFSVKISSLNLDGTPVSSDSFVIGDKIRKEIESEYEIIK